MAREPPHKKLLDPALRARDGAIWNWPTEAKQYQSAPDPTKVWRVRRHGREAIRVAEIAWLLRALPWSLSQEDQITPGILVPLRPRGRWRNLPISRAAKGLLEAGILQYVDEDSSSLKLTEKGASVLNALCKRRLDLLAARRGGNSGQATTRP